MRAAKPGMPFFRPETSERPSYVISSGRSTKWRLCRLILSDLVSLRDYRKLCSNEITYERKRERETRTEILNSAPGFKDFPRQDSIALLQRWEPDTWMRASRFEMLPPTVSARRDHKITSGDPDVISIASTLLLWRLQDRSALIASAARSAEC